MKQIISKFGGDFRENSGFVSKKIIVSDVCDGITCTDVDTDATCAPGDDGVGYCTCSSNRYDGPRCEIGKNSGIQPMTINGTMIDIRINTFKLNVIYHK